MIFESDPVITTALSYLLTIIRVCHLGEFEVSDIVCRKLHDYYDTYVIPAQVQATEFTLDVELLCANIDSKIRRLFCLMTAIHLHTLPRHGPHHRSTSRRSPVMAASGIRMHTQYSYPTSDRVLQQQRLCRYKIQSPGLLPSFAEVREGSDGSRPWYTYDDDVVQ